MNPSYLRLLAILLLPLLAPACARLQARDELPFRMTLELNKKQYLPGEPVICAVNLLNDSSTTRSVLIPSHASMRFTVASRHDPNDLKFVDPVFSLKEPVGARLELGRFNAMPQARRFVFPQLTFERGEFVLQATHEQPRADNLSLTRRTYSRPLRFAVAGQKAFVQRYRSGLITKEAAVAIAEKSVSVNAESADIILVRDDKGFLKWWVNLELASGAEAKSCFVDPYLAQVWKVAQPFTRREKQARALPLDRALKGVRQFRERTHGTPPAAPNSARTDHPKNNK